ncbi:MAG: NAD(P)/FAD-dependent oxidoreductase [Deltaproteobacteria bacterium]|nr:NAD(P)/FAD-dependent oxidoreductase [Nannocystaceae bacterium]
MSEHPRHVHVAIIGTGFAGLGVAAELLRTGIDDFVLLERAGSIGGTWRDNHYPGCACDIPSHLYSFSFAPKPDWSRAYAPWHEIRAYLERFVDDAGLRAKIELEQTLASARWDAGTSCWQLRTRQGLELTARFLVLAAGGLSNAAFADIPGRERFAGPQFHSAQWDHDVDLAGKRVAVIGTGASAIQFVPQIQPTVGKLYLLQRTPPWILPKPDRAYSGFTKTALRVVPGLRALYRQSIYWRLEARLVAFTEAPKLMAIAERTALRHIEASIADPELRARVTPKYRPGCKRILLSNDYYPALTQPNVELLDDRIEAIVEHGVRFASGRELEVDVLIHGTGFAVHDYLGGVQVYGEGGVELGELWSHGAEAYLGTAIAGFPNLFMIVGPNTGLGHNSMIVMIEGQAHYAVEAIGLARARKLAAIAVKPEVQRDYNAWVQGKNAAAIWATGCRSWYLDARGKNTSIFPSFATAFRRRTAKVRLDDFELTPG